MSAEVGDVRDMEMYATPVNGGVEEKFGRTFITKLTRKKQLRRLQIDAAYLKEKINDFPKHFNVCTSLPFVTAD